MPRLQDLHCNAFSDPRVTGKIRKRNITIPARWRTGAVILANGASPVEWNRLESSLGGLISASSSPRRSARAPQRLINYQAGRQHKPWVPQAVGATSGSDRTSRHWTVWKMSINPGNILSISIANNDWLLILSSRLRVKPLHMVAHSPHINPKR